MNIYKLITIVVTVLASLFILLAIVFYIGLNDSSASNPVYDGPIIPHEQQTPLNSGFDRSTTAMEIIDGIDLTGKTIVMTGGHSGTGLEASKAFVSAGAKVIALSRNLEVAKSNLQDIQNVSVFYVDLLKPDSINKFVDHYLNTGEPIDVLVNSAGIIGTPLTRDERGYELQFSTNVLGHFQLIVGLIPALEKAKNGARIVNLASRAHRANGVNFEDINFENSDYSGMKAYAQSKTALVLLSLKLDKLLKGKNIRVFSVHPGPIPTTDIFAASQVGISSTFTVWMFRMLAKTARATHLTEILNFVRNPNNEADLYKTVQQGGATTVWASVSPLLEGKGGLYLEDSNVAVVVPNGSDAPFGVRPWALNEEDADKLWKLCEEMTGVNYLN